MKQIYTIEIKREINENERKLLIKMLDIIRLSFERKYIIIIHETKRGMERGMLKCISKIKNSLKV